MYVLEIRELEQREKRSMSMKVNVSFVPASILTLILAQRRLYQGADLNLIIENDCAIALN